MSVGAAWRRKFNIEPTPEDLRGVVEERNRLKAINDGLALKIEQQGAELRAAKGYASVLSGQIRSMTEGSEAEIDRKVAERCAELAMKAERAEAMCADLRAIIETHNAANGAELRQAMAAERDEAVRLLRVARAQESEARQEAWDTRQFLIAAQQIVEGFKEKLESLENALGEKLDPGRYYYQS